MLYLDLKGYLGEGVLTKTDRASMAYSLEVRVPLLDRRVVELAASLPMGLKLHGLTTKYVLKRALAGVLPRETLARPKWASACLSAIGSEASSIDSSARCAEPTRSGGRSLSAGDGRAAPRGAREPAARSPKEALHAPRLPALGFALSTGRSARHATVGSQRMSTARPTTFTGEEYANAYPEGIERHYWTLARNHQVERLLRRAPGSGGLVLDIGCGARDHRGVPARTRLRLPWFGAFRRGDPCASATTPLGERVLRQTRNSLLGTPPGVRAPALLARALVADSFLPRRWYGSSIAASPRPRLRDHGRGRRVHRRLVGGASSARRGDSRDIFGGFGLLTPAREPLLDRVWSWRRDFRWI
jgi:hypothetical protein